MWCVFVIAMDAWRRELQESLQRELEGSNDEGFEEGLLKMFVAIGEEIVSHHRLHLNLENIEWDEDIFIGRERERL